MLDFLARAVGFVDLGLRERQKQERRQRIESAARDVFREKGYPAATTREIAERAGVSIGTLFAYAAEKRDLLTMVFRDGLRALTVDAFASVPADAPVIEQLEHVLRPRYVFWGADPALARHAVRETFSASYPANPSSDAAPPEFALREHLRSLVERNQTRGAILPTDDPAVIARLILDVYLTENREWLAEPSPQVDAGVRRLVTVLTVALRGVVAN